MMESNQNNIRQMSTMDLYLALQVCNPMLLKSYDPKIRKFKRIWRMKTQANHGGDSKHSGALLLNTRLHVCTQQSKPT